jgi:hypothetical protein
MRRYKRRYMPLTSKDIDELKAIHRLQFHEELTDDEGWEMARRLLGIFRLLAERSETGIDLVKSSNDPPLDHLTGTTLR